MIIWSVVGEWLQLRIRRLLRITDSTRITLKALALLLNLRLQLKEPTFVSVAIILWDSLPSHFLLSKFQTLWVSVYIFFFFFADGGCSSKLRRARSSTALSQWFNCWYVTYLYIANAFKLLVSLFLLIRFHWSCVDYKKELRSLNRELQLHILELADVLVERPSQYAKRIGEISSVFKNLHHLLNSLRPHQVRRSCYSMFSSVFGV